MPQSYIQWHKLSGTAKPKNKADFCQTMICDRKEKRIEMVPYEKVTKVVHNVILANASRLIVIW